MSLLDGAQRASADEVKEALSAEGVNAEAPVSDSPTEEPQEQPVVEAQEAPEVKEEEVEQPTYKEPTIPKYRFDEVNQARKEAEQKARKIEELEAMGYSVDEIKEFVREQIKGNPEALDGVKLKKTLASTQQQIARLSETVELNDFIRTNPDAGQFQNQLARLKKAYPEKSFSELYQETFEPIKARMKPKVSAETGRGSSTTMKSSGISNDDFKKLSMDKQSEYLKKLGY
jgi:DNA-binding transcriptional MerR regulator